MSGKRFIAMVAMILAACTVFCACGKTAAPEATKNIFAKLSYFLSISITKLFGNICIICSNDTR